ncbi:MAG: MFS transporter [Flavobacteriales bacterium]|nr:MFS transporter [Flavobacteriales bacterium]
MFELMKATKKEQNAWAMYDWANSTYNLVIGTAIFPIFYSAVTKDASDGAEGDNVIFFGHIFKNTEVLSYSLALGMAMVCILAPTLAGVADYLGRKKMFMRLFCYLGALSCASLYFFDVQHLERSMLSIVFACVGFWCSYAFANSFLPELAEPEEQDKLSAKGFSFGYAGSVFLLVINLVMIQVFDISARWCFVTVGVWWIGFAHYTFYHLKEHKKDVKFNTKVIGNGFNELRKVWGQMKITTRLKGYLIAFFVFSMGVQTIMQMASLFGTKEVTRIDENGVEVVGLASGQLIVAVLLVQVIAIPGAMIFSWASKKWGNLNTLKIALFIWAGICLFAYFVVHSPMEFYIAAGSIGFIMGGTQSLARSTYSKFLPETNDHASFFSFYDVTEKVGLIIGLLAFGYLEGSFGSMRASVLALIVFFFIGLILVFLIPKREKSIEGRVFRV